MSTKIQLGLAALLAVGLLAFSASSASAKYEQATFKAEVKGVQTYVAEQHIESNDRCEIASDSATKETVRFESRKPVLLTATDIPGVKGLVLTGAPGKPLRFPTKAKVSRNHSSSYTPIPEDCGGNGGGVVPTPPDCGARTISPWWLSADFYKRGHIELQPEDISGSSPFENCGSGKFPYLLNGEVFGKRSDAELPEEDVFNEKYGKIIVLGKGSEGIVYPGGFEKTTIRWDISLTRIKDKK